MLLTIAILAGALVLLTGTLQLRGILGLPFPTVGARLVQSPLPPPAGSEDLYAKADETLAELGFADPVWVINDYEPADVSAVTVQKVYRHRALATLAWLTPPLNVSQPNCLMTYFTTTLADGRQAVTQVSDPYFEALGDPQTPAQTLPPTEPDAALQRHVDFVKELGGEQKAGGTSDEAIVRFASEWQNAIRERLLAAGSLRIDEGLTRPGLRFGFSLLKTVRSGRHRAKKPALEHVPAKRQAILARSVELAGHRAPAPPLQLLLMIASGVLFVALGAFVFGVQWSAIILAVIVFHEGGHWLAMRMCGYRNVHITLLPLLGGVTMGYETDPSAAKRAWVSLAGPLPGIILGWAILIPAMWSGTMPGGWILSTALVLLAINYLNVLPVPPLDGSHLLRALIPPRWSGIQAGLLVLGIGFGVAIAWWMGLWILALLAVVQVWFARQLWRNGQAIRYFDGTPPPAHRPRGLRRAWVLEELEKRFGPTAKASSRIVQAEEILNLIDMKPLGALHRTALGGLYAALLAVPAVALAFAVMSSFPTSDLAALEEESALYESRRVELTAQAQTMTTADLIAALNSEQADIPLAATADAIQTVESRLGATLPASLKTIYEIANGVPWLGLAPVGEIGPAAQIESARITLESMSFDGTFFLDLGDGEWGTEVPQAVASDWWFAGNGANAAIFIDSEPEPALAGRSFIDFNRDPQAFDDAGAWLRAIWVNQQLDEESSVRYDARVEAAFQRMDGVPATELLGEFEQPTLFQRLFARLPAWPEPAEAAAITALELRLGRALPDDHRAVLELHDGFPPVQLLAADGIRPFSEYRQANRDDMSYVFEEPFRAAGGINEAFAILPETVQACWVIGAYASGQPDRELTPNLLWCPDEGLPGDYVSLQRLLFHDNLTGVIRQAAANWKAF